MSAAETGSVEAISAQVRTVESGLTHSAASWASTAAPGSTSFSNFVAQGVDKVNATLLRADTALSQAAVDGTQPPHQVMLALEEARMSFNLALQVRNRLLEGYQELMRMQV